MQASAQSPGSPINITTSTPVCVMEKNPLQSSAKESREASTELSWVTMAREKTRSLQQLFTSTLNDLAGLQTTTQPAGPQQTQITSQPSAGPIRPKHQISSAETSVSPFDTQLPTVHASVRRTHLIQPPTPKSSISPAQPSIEQLGGVNFSFKQTFSPSQVQPTYLSARSGQASTHSATKPQIMHAAQQQMSQKLIHQAHPVQQSLPLSVTEPQASPSLSLPLSPKLTPHQLANQSHSPFTQARPLGENTSPLPLGKVDCTFMPQEKSPGESQALHVGGLGSKVSHIEQWHHQKPDAIKVRLMDFWLYCIGSYFKSKLLSALFFTL